MLRAPIVVPRRTIPHYGRQQGEHGEHASLAHVPETVVVRGGEQQQRPDPRPNGGPRSRQILRPVWRGSIPRLGGPQQFRWSSKGHMHDNASAARPPSTRHQ